jgi:hypothetical protein
MTASGNTFFLRTWFGVSAVVTRRDYLTAGISLFALKYAIEGVLAWTATGQFLTPIAFLSPFYMHRAALFAAAPPGYNYALLAVTLPFLWVGVTMSVRRAADARLPPWLGFGFLVPGVNFLLMALLAARPSVTGEAPLPRTGAFREAPPVSTHVRSGVLQAPFLRAVGAASLVGVSAAVFLVDVVRTYGATLFLLTPAFMGFVAADVYVRGREALAPVRAKPNHGLMVSLTVTVSLLVVGTVLLITAKEGLACLVMAFIPAVLLAGLAALLYMAIHKTGSRLARDWKRSQLAIALALPAIGGAEAATQREVEYRITSSVEVDAPPEAVWDTVVRFPPLGEPEEFLFKAGVACPMSARIEGEGVGAVRYCTFTTGSFVEPITTWDAPHHLAFDVAQNPPPMRELSPYEFVDAPHLDGFMSSRRGEFVIEALPGGRSRLSGTTVYTLEIFPAAYWRVWTDEIVRTIHGRVLRHVKTESERVAKR